MATFNLADFRAKALPFAGARPTLFTVDLVFPFATQFADRARFQIRASSVPSVPIDKIRVPYMGRAIKLVGDRPDFPDWTVTVINDENFPLRVALEKWSNLMNALISNRMDETVFPQGYKTNAVVTQYGKVGDTLRRYVIDGIFPVNVDAMQLDWDAQNRLQEFDVTFSLDFAYPDFNLQTNADDNGLNVVMPDDQAIS